MTHAAFASASLVSFGATEDSEAVAAARALLPADGVIARNHFETIGRRRLFLVDEHGEPASFDFAVESESGMTERELVERAFAALASRFARATAVTTQLRDDPKHLQFSVPGEGHTFGSVLQSVAVDEAEGLGLTSVGYFEPHPLDPRIVVKARTMDTAPTRADPGDLFREMCAAAADRVSEAMQAFSESSRTK